MKETLILIAVLSVVLVPASTILNDRYVGELDIDVMLPTCVTVSDSELSIFESEMVDIFKDTHTLTFTYQNYMPSSWQRSCYDLTGEYYEGIQRTHNDGDLWLLFSPTTAIPYKDWSDPDSVKQYSGGAYYGNGVCTTPILNHSWTVVAWVSAHEILHHLEDTGVICCDPDGLPGDMPPRDQFDYLLSDYCVCGGII